MFHGLEESILLLKKQTQPDSTNGGDQTPFIKKQSNLIVIDLEQEDDDEKGF